MRKVAPELWRVMVKQQYAKAAAEIIMPFGMVVVAIIWHLVMRRAWTGRKTWNQMDEAESIGFSVSYWILPLGLGFLGGVFAVHALSESIRYLINPEYYAVRDILLMVLNPAAVK